ncbi:MAG TPA: MBL fold metallo-hydrolase [Gammaproteobacteria bacterium]|nr:MBL fold metallo-hydrolase [Gammaproteobacteria bacterium]
MKKLALTALCATYLSGYALAQDAKTVIADAQRALGNPQSITYSGSAHDVAFQQCGSNAAALICYGTHDPMRPIMEYVRVIDLNGPLSRHTGKTMNPAGGGNTVPAPGVFFQQVTAQQADVSQPWAQSLEFYITPWGFLKGAAANSTTAARRNVDGKSYTVLTWSPTVKAPSGKAYTVNGYVNSANIVERVETWLGENIMGDMQIVADYKDWRDFGGVQIPTHIVQTRGGWPFFDVEVASARGNPPNLAQLAVDTRPPPPAGGPGGGGGPPGGAPPAMTVTAEKLADGVFRYTTGAGSYDSLVVEFNNYIMMLEAGQSQARAAAYVAEIKKQFPDKPIRYVMVTHPHADHTGGLPVLVAEGATLVVQENSREFYERALNTPRTLLDDALAKAPKRAKIETVADKKVYTDGTHTVEMYHIYPAPHSNALLIAYLPKEKVLFQGDFSVNPAQGGGTQPANDHVQALVPALAKLGITDYTRYINVHASTAPQTKADVTAAMNALPR